MAQTITPYREDGNHRGPVEPSRREEFVRAALEKKFGIKDPQRWIAMQAEADEPVTGNRSTSNWSSIWHKCPQPLALDIDKCVWLLRKYCKRLTPSDVLEPQSVTYTLVSLLCPTDVELYDAGDGYYLVVPDPDRLYKLHQGPRDNGTRCHVYSTAEFTPAEYYGLIDASVFWAWRSKDREKAAEARDYVCRPYAKAIAEAAREAEEEYGRATIVGYTQKSDVALQIPHVVVWTWQERDGFSAWLFDGSAFSPDSFVASVPERFDDSGFQVDDLLYGEHGIWIFKTRILLERLRHLWKLNKMLGIMRCRTVKRADPDEDDVYRIIDCILPGREARRVDVLFVHQDCVRIQLPEGGKRIL